MSNSPIAVCSTTWYPEWVPGKRDFEAILHSGDPRYVHSIVRGDIALETLSEVIRAGLTLCLVDGGEEGSAFQKALIERSIPFEQQEERGMGPSRRQAFNAALEREDSEAIVWLDPEKCDLVKEIEASAQPVLTGEAAMVVIERKQQGWDTLPGYQRESERKGNEIFCHNLHEASLLDYDRTMDVFFGGRVYSATQQYRQQMKKILNARYGFKNRNGTESEAIQPDTYSVPLFFPLLAAYFAKNSANCVVWR